MIERLVLATDLDRTLIPNGPQPESPSARVRFEALVGRPEVTLVYVTGRHRELVESAVSEYALPLPDFVIGDVGTTIYDVQSEDHWKAMTNWENHIAGDWNGLEHPDLCSLLRGISDLELQEPEKQNRCKLSYYVASVATPDSLIAAVRRRLEAAGVRARVVFSVDEQRRVGLLDILPAKASKLHALEALMRPVGIGLGGMVFCGDSGNDLEVLASPIPAVLVANSTPEVKNEAVKLAGDRGNGSALYIAQGDFLGLNGNYSAGILEGVAHYHPNVVEWMGVPVTDSTND